MKATPVQMRQTLEVVEILRRTSTRFVPMPVLTDEDALQLNIYMAERMAMLVDEVDDEQGPATQTLSLRPLCTGRQEELVCTVPVQQGLHDRV